jgi:hypothetical protein
MMLDTAVTDMSLVKVWTEVDDDGKCQSLPAKIVSKKGNVFKIRYLSSTGVRDSKNRRIYSYEDETYEVTNDSITEYIDSDTELDFGFEEIGNGQFVKCDYDILCGGSDDDDDYVPSTENEDSSDGDSDDTEDEEISGDEYTIEEDENFSD